jgi:uncharacterized membrane protein YhaH (DUF805 family)
MFFHGRISGREFYVRQICNFIDVLCRHIMATDKLKDAGRSAVTPVITYTA